jgi:hypothetical protein
MKKRLKPLKAIVDGKHREVGLHLIAAHRAIEVAGKTKNHWNLLESVNRALDELHKARRVTTEVVHESWGLRRRTSGQLLIELAAACDDLVRTIGIRRNVAEKRVDAGYKRIVRMWFGYHTRMWDERNERKEGGIR